MANFVFRCPATGRPVSRPNRPQPDTYETITFRACGSLHLLNRSTGGILVFSDWNDD